MYNPLPLTETSTSTDGNKRMIKDVAYRPENAFRKSQMFGIECFPKHLQWILPRRQTIKVRELSFRCTYKKNFSASVFFGAEGQLLLFF